MTFYLPANSTTLIFKDSVISNDFVEDTYIEIVYEYSNVTKQYGSGSNKILFVPKVRNDAFINFTLKKDSESDIELYNGIQEIQLYSGPCTTMANGVLEYYEIIGAYVTKPDPREPRLNNDNFVNYTLRGDFKKRIK